MCKELLRLRAAFLLLGSMLLAVAGFGQGVTTSSISGVVTDEKNEPLPGATVVAVHTPSGTQYGITTNGEGRYTFPAVRVGGPYTVTVSYVGFQNATADNLYANLGSAANANVKLVEQGRQLTEVVITGSRSAVINSDRTGAATGINATQLQTLPTLSRSFQDFTRLDPRANGLSFGGRNSGFNNFTVDGALFNNAFGLASTPGGQANAQPISLDALDQIQVAIAPYDVRQGSFTGAGINATTRSGTNQFQASLYYFTRNQNYVGDKIGKDNPAQPVNAFTFQNYGFRVGGPIIKNKLFFFANYERERRNDGVPGNWVAGRPGLTGENVSTASAADLDRLRTFVTDRFGFDPGAYENYQLPSNSDKGAFKIDWNISQNHKFNIKYNFLRSYRDIQPSGSGGLPQGRGPNANALPFLASFYRINNNLDSYIAELNSTFGSRFANTFQVGYTAFRDFRETPFLPSNFPLVDIGNGAGQQLTAFGYEPFSFNNVLNTDVFQISDNFTIFAGKHTFTIGTYNEFYKFRNGFAPNYQSSYQFASVDAFISNVTQQPIAGGTAIANPTRFQIQYAAQPGGPFPFADIRAAQYGFYVQDEYQPRRNLKFTLGLRADIPTVPTEIQQNENLARLTNFRDGVQINTSQFPKASLLFSPRLGFNWDVNDDKITQVRGGIGVFTGRVPYVWISNQASNNGVLFGSVQINNPPATGANARPFNPNVDAYRPVDPAANTAYNIAVSDQNFKFPQVFRANVAVDRNLGDGFLLTLEGIYTKDLNSVYHQNVNLPLPTQNLRGPEGGDNRPIFYNNNNNGFPATPYGRIYGALGQGGTTPAAQISASNPNISDVILMRNTNLGYSYNLTAELQKQWANGFFAKAAYTYTDARSVNDGGSIAQTIWRDRQVSGDPNANILAQSSFLQPHNIVGAASYKFSYLNNRLATTIALFYNGSSGSRYSYIYGGQADFNGDGQTVNDLIFIPRNRDDIRLRNLTVGSGAAATVYTADQQWNDLNAFIEQDPYLSKRRGQYAERNGAENPFVSRLDLKVIQDIGTMIGRDKHTLQVSLDIFNFGNLLNADWGNAQVVRAVAPITFVGYDNGVGGTGRPEFQFPFQNTAARTVRTETFQLGSALANRWQAQLGIRYLFN